MTEYDDHIHKFFIWKTFEGYEPTVTYEDGKPTTDIAYYKREYAIVGCNCSEVRKVRVKEQ